MSDLTKHLYDTALAMNRAAAEMYARSTTTLTLYDDEGCPVGDVEASPDDTRESLLEKWAQEWKCCSAAELRADGWPLDDYRFCRQHSHELAPCERAK